MGWGGPRGLVALASMTLALGCGGGTSDAGGAPTSAEGFCKAVEAEYAIADARCFGGAPADWSSPSTDVACTAIGKLTTTIQYHPAMAKDCLSTLKAELATDCLASVDCVDETLKGLVPDGQPCTQAAECGHNVTCLRSDDTSCASAICTPPAPVGAPCFPYCASGGICDATNTCVPATEVDAGGVCGDPTTLTCKGGLHCAFDPVTTGQTGLCQETKTGSACLTDADCLLFQDFCDTTCKPRLAIGAPCTDHPSGCIAVGVCDPVSNRCAPAGHLGQSCGLDGICLDGMCDSAAADAPTCIPFKELGAACQSGYECKSTVCQSSVCTDCPR